jgi:hypothetical protein
VGGLTAAHLSELSPAVMALKGEIIGLQRVTRKHRRIEMNLFDMFKAGFSVLFNGRPATADDFVPANGKAVNAKRISKHIGGKQRPRNYRQARKARRVAAKRARRANRGK